MSQIVVVGLGEGQKIHLVRHRKPEGPLKNWEVVHKNKSDVVIGYRKTLGSNNIEWVQLNKLIVKEWDNEKTGKSWSYSLVITAGTGSHRIDLGGGMLATSIANTLCSLINKTKEEIEGMTFNFNFYMNKKGYNTCYITDGSGETLDWYMSAEEQASYVRKAPNSLNPEKIDTDRSNLHKQFMELAPALNAVLPKGNYNNGSALDGIDDDMDDITTQEADADEVFAGDTKPATPAPVKDIPFAD